MWLIVKFQARVRGMLTRNKLRRSPGFRDLFNRYSYVGEPQYENEKVQQIRTQVGEFNYGYMNGIDNNNLEYRPAMILESQAMFEGQWIKGSMIRTGRGK